MASIIARSCALSNPVLRRAVFNAARNMNLSTTAAVRFDDNKNIPKNYFKHKEMQKLMRKETGEMIYLKTPGGGKGKVYLFGFTVLLAIYLMIENLRWFYKKSWPEAN